MEKMVLYLAYTVLPDPSLYSPHFILPHTIGSSRNVTIPQLDCSFLQQPPFTRLGNLSEHLKRRSLLSKTEYAGPGLFPYGAWVFSPSSVWIAGGVTDKCQGGPVVKGKCLGVVIQSWASHFTSPCSSTARSAINTIFLDGSATK
jgi:hypothetical protein